MSNDSTKQRYQFFRKVDSISFDNIRDNIETMATPCSEVLELTYDQYTILRQAIRGDWHFSDVELRCLNTWFTTDEIMATIETEMVRAENELRRQAALAAKRAQQEQAKAAKKTAFKAQCEGKNGKVKAVKPVKVQANPTEADRKADRKARSEFQVSKWKVKS